MDNFDYYDYKIASATDRLKQEIVFYRQTPYADIDIFAEYISYLENRIGVGAINQIKPVHRYDNTGTKYEIKKIEMDKHLEYCEYLQFKKPWRNLHEFHKIMKINEFVDALVWPKSVPANKISQNKTKIKEEIAQGIRDKRFVKNKSVITYDPEKMQIEYISCLFFDDDTKLYIVDYDE